MPLPLLAILASAFGGAFVAHAYDKEQERRNAQRNIFSSYATTLTPGASYQLMVRIDPTNASWQKLAIPPTPAAASEVLANAFAQLGWQILGGPPILMTPADAQQWALNQPATWTFVGRWTLPSNAMPAPAWAAWIGMMNAYLLPTS